MQTLQTQQEKIEPSRGATRLEIAFIVVIVATVGLLAVTKYLDLSVAVEESAESGVIAAVREAISEHAERAQTQGGQSVFPRVLDKARVGEASSSNPLFSNVLQVGIAITGWAKLEDNLYRTPSGERFVYDPTSGYFGNVEKIAEINR